MISKKYFLIIISALIIFVIGIFAIRYLYLREQKEQITTPLGLEQTAAGIDSEEIFELCKGYEDLEIAISCEDALDIIFKFGENIEKISSIKPFPEGHDSENVWLVEMSFKETTNNGGLVKVFINENKEVIITR